MSGSFLILSAASLAIGTVLVALTKLRGAALDRDLGIASDKR